MVGSIETMHNVPDGSQILSGNGLSTPILRDSISAVKGDIGLARRAIRERWPMSDEARRGLMERLQEVVDKRVVEVPTKTGPAFLDGPADANAVAAARVLVAMDGQNQADAQFEAKEADKSTSGDTYNIGCVGQIALGQEPLTPEDAKRQVQEVLARVRARIGVTSPPPEKTTVIDVTPAPAKSSGLADL